MPPLPPDDVESIEVEDRGCLVWPTVGITLIIALAFCFRWWLETDIERMRTGVREYLIEICDDRTETVTALEDCVDDLKKRFDL